MRNRYSVLVDGVLSATAAHNYEFGLNPDVEELKLYNREAKQRECQHLRVDYWPGNGDKADRNICRDCGAHR